MKLKMFSITNYRSITNAHQINISDLTVLIGRNNEGKSNILKALNVAMTSIQNHARGLRFGRSYRNEKNEESYSWGRDFPIALQEQRRETQSIFTLEFGLDDNEIEGFRSIIDSNVDGLLITTKYGKESEPIIEMSKPGNNAEIFPDKLTQKISRFILDKIYFNYIPAVRTDQEAIRIIREMVLTELGILQKQEKYVKALRTIENLQKPILKGLEKKIQDPLNKFLPNIKSVKIEISENSRIPALRRDVDVVIDDGYSTSIEFKGDGVKSLATLALLKNRYTSDSSSIVAIEEPESHLHPAAMHQLKDIISDLSLSNQVIISTHSPLFVERENLASNIIIRERIARPAKSIKEIRELLGVQASDNLINAEYVLVVEGSDDKISLLALLPILSPKIGKAIKKHRLIIDALGGSDNLTYKLSIWSNMLCSCHVLLDSDEAGSKAFKKASLEDFVSDKNCTFTNCIGMREAEFEDVLNSNIYMPAIKKKYGVDLEVKEFTKTSNRFKWSDRVKKVFISQGKLWGDQVEADIKGIVVTCVKKYPQNALDQYKRSSIDALVMALEDMIH